MGKWKEKRVRSGENGREKCKEKMKHDIFIRNALKILIKNHFRNASDGERNNYVGQ